MLKKKCACCNQKFSKKEFVEMQTANGEIILCCNNCKKYFKEIKRR